MAKFNILPTMVFPSTKMASVNKLITEGSLTRLINKLLDTDSYIIPPINVDAAPQYEIVNNETCLILPETNGYTENLEFMLHGYYFNLGPIVSLINNYPEELNGEYRLSAQIFIDNTVKDYPELFGETDIVQSYQTPYETALKLDTTKCAKESVKSVMFYGQEPDSLNLVEYSSGHINSDNTIECDSPLQDSTYATHIVKVYYYNYSNIINLYLDKTDEITPDTAYTSTQIGGETTEVISTSLLYVTYKDKLTKVAIPYTNFAKFNHQSISSIDGGLITY